ncbi:serine O-acetyltransferase [Ruegeria sp. MALMAid1280]|uniref:serine O-acetyltransferase n=1 Tax=Ruegeria sp. MALMAid1280 TaxID=3411634 RepID=UPI003BA2EF51
MKVEKANGHSRQAMYRFLLAEVDHMKSEEPVMHNLLAHLAEASSLEQLLACQLSTILQTLGFEHDILADMFAELLLANPSITNAVVSDFEAVCARDPACASFLHALLNYKGFQALQAHRISHQLWNDGRTQLASWLANRVSVVLGPDIHPAARIGRGVLIDHGSGVVIGETVVIDDGVSIMQNVTLGGTGNETGDRHPKIAQGVMIGGVEGIWGSSGSKMTFAKPFIQECDPYCRHPICALWGPTHPALLAHA